MNAATPPTNVMRQRVTIGGRVQGVGFRPYVYRLAKQHGLAGFVANERDGVVLEIEGDAQVFDNFLNALRTDVPVQARIDSLSCEIINNSGANDFRISESVREFAIDSETALSIPVDLAICDNCRAELFDPTNRRYRHPFIACCDCGPRWSTLAALPWNRANTALANFSVCAECATEYSNSDNRRLHAQNNCCQNCGPQLALWNRSGETLAERDNALRETVAVLRKGAIVAVKGLGGFHLMVDARNADAIARLRERKQRPHKPLAVMFESIAQIENYCEIENAERALLTSSEAPIVLLNSRCTFPETLALEVLAPKNPRLGALLAYAPIHLLLLHDAGFPLVATSGNRSGDPICADAPEALEKLGAIADYFLVHERPILNPIDDSVVQIAAGRPMLLRCARGYAPLDFSQDDSIRESYIALGGQLKNTIALSDGKRIFISPHIGDLGNTATENALRHTIDALKQFSKIHPTAVVCDAHPDYRSSHLAHEFSDTPMRVQHHHAHIAAVMCEHNLDGEVLGIAWDGSGFGADGTLWGGEFLQATRASYTRIAALRSFALPGGETAAREPRRAALSLLHALSAGDLKIFSDLTLFSEFTAAQLNVLQTMLDRNVNCPRSSSVGRLFDAVAALLGLHPVATFEGQSAMALQFFAERYAGEAKPFNFTIDKTSAPYRIDWRPLIENIIAALRENIASELIAARFHVTLTSIAATIAETSRIKRIVLAGGCFQNRLLLESTLKSLRELNCEVFWPQRLPCNDGALALGQIAIAQAK